MFKAAKSKTAKAAAGAGAPAFARNHPGAVKPPGRLQRLGAALPAPRLLPVVMAVSLLALGARLGDLWGDLREARLPTIITLQQAQAAAPTPEAAPAAAAPAEQQMAAATTEAPDADAAAPAAPVSLGAGQSFKPDEDSLLRALGARRLELDERERDIDRRAALLEASQQQIDRKLGELQKLRDELQAMTAGMDKAREKQILDLVKIYETMKPGDAARILDGLEMDVLLEVVGRMKSAKTAPVLAAMNPATAKELTMRLAERQALPREAAATQ